MGRKSTTGGVSPLGDSRIQLYFRFQLQRCRPTLDLKPTPPNLAYARRLVADIEQRIRNGTFDLGKEFPDYKGLARFQAERPVTKTVRQYVELWQAANTNKSPSTLAGYTKIFNRHWIPWFGDRAIGSVLPSEIGAAIGVATKSRKTYNNVLACGRVVFALALVDGVISVNPAAAVAFLEIQGSTPDPFTIEEAERILAGLQERWGPEIADYYEFAFYSGLRPNEQIEIQWPDVDEATRTLRVARGKVEGIVKDTKTYEQRLVELHSRAWAVLERQKARTRLAAEHIFLNPHTGEPYVDERSQRRFFNSVVNTLTIRARPAKNTRHTYATIMLMSDANPTWAAGQLGHSKVVFLKTYSTWIDRQDSGRQMAKVEAYTAAGSIPERAIESTDADISTGQSTGQTPEKRRFRTV
jgi:integrase